MDITARTVFIAGGTSGIGLALAHRLTAAGSTVIIGGRRAIELAGIDSVVIDVTDPTSVEAARDAVLAAHPDLDTIVTMSGIAAPEDLRDPAHFADAEAIISTNLLGTIRVIDAFTPYLIDRGAGTIVTVSSGIGFLPFPLMASYGASKAAVHAYSESLRAQLANEGIEVVEIVPPAVATTMGSSNPRALELGAFIEEVVGLLSAEPTPHEVLVEAVHMHRWAERDGTYDELVTERSAALALRDRREP
jgi:short-subunit dehydrogenase involved in D-alanine esterification of teichoic acids